MELTKNEKYFVIILFKSFVIRKQKYVFNSQIILEKRNCIDVLDIKFIKIHEKKNYFKTLVKKNILKKNKPFGYRLFIKKEFIDQIYTLAEAEQWDLIEQLASVWADNE
ncbi:MAG: hypothetical protein EAZ85_06400 [Bacteroidetes bacterium]|nr:MAG: hypothetical protein EAZ85_06400 [Bacteroidota bacterium]TAG86625.1 MAG: hypothetical protein EAZ20_12380 [Bacteroidota bacterium]